MKIKSAIVALIVVSLLVGISAFGKGSGDLAAPDPEVDRAEWPTVGVSWIAVPNAVKYSVVVEGVITVFDRFEDNPDGDTIDIEIEVEIGTTEDTSIEFELADVKADILAQLSGMGYIMPDDIESLNEELAMVKVKGLDPSLPEVKRQNNPWGTEPLFEPAA